MNARGFCTCKRDAPGKPHLHPPANATWHYLCDRPVLLPPLPSLASCGHPANEDGECDCSSWPERSPWLYLEQASAIVPTGTGWPPSADDIRAAIARREGGQ